MKLGISSYSLVPSLQSGEMDIEQALEWMKEQGADHADIVPIALDLEGDRRLASRIRTKARALGMEVAGYAVSGNVLEDSMSAYAAEIDRLKRQVDIAAELGAARMRHDIVPWAHKPAKPGDFERDFGRFVEACGAVADYAVQYGITTMVENHGYYVVSSDRVIRLVEAVNRPNFRMLVDIGNFLCVDEDPACAVQNSLPYAAAIHFKDFYIRKPDANPGEGWLQTLGGRYIRGAIFGQGDLDVRAIIRTIQSSGYDGPISIEFEGMEQDRLGTRIGYANARRLWDEA